MKRYADENRCFGVQGVLPLTNNSSLAIFRITYKWGDDFVEAGMLISDAECVDTRLYKVYSNTKGNYFKYKGSRYYLHEFYRC